MPVIDGVNDEWEPVKRYQWPAQYTTPTEEMDDALRGWRKEAIKEQEEFTKLLSQVRASDFIWLRRRQTMAFLRERINHWRKMQRACTYMLPWMGTPDKRQEPIAPRLWPVDLAPELDEISNRLILRLG